MKITIERTFEPKHITGENDKGKYDFWSVGIISADRLINVTGTEEYVKSLQSGDTLEGDLEEKPYIKDGEQKMSYKFKRPKRDVYAELDDLQARILVLEDAILNDVKVNESVSDFPEITDEDIANFN
jgi:hypothetical protein